MISLGLFNSGCTNQPKRNVTLEKKVDSLSNSVRGLEPQISGLKKQFDAQVAEIEASLSAQNNSHKLLEEKVSETGNFLQEIKQNIDLVEKDKDRMKVQLDEFGSQFNRLETVSKITERKLFLQKELLNNAVELYKQQKFKEAILKWEEVLATDPENPEAKFNIEVTNDRIKQNEKDKALKTLLAQKKYKDLSFFALTVPSSSSKEK
jgi:outer membrane murein-binding lipoprotein Lpp